jgi:hypothetical protein
MVGHEFSAAHITDTSIDYWRHRFRWTLASGGIKPASMAGGGPFPTAAGT